MRSLLILILLVALPAYAAGPSSNYAPWSYDGLYLKDYKVYWDSVVFTFKDGSGQTFTNWSKDGHRCPNQPSLVLNSNNPEWKLTMRAIIAAGLAEKRMHVWFWGQTSAQNPDPQRRCYLQGIQIEM